MFDLELTKEESYMIGFLQCDGHLSQGTRNRGKLQLEVSVRDRDIIEKFYEIISKKYNVSIYERTRDTNFKDDYSSISLNVFDQEFRRLINRYIPYGKKDSLITPPGDVSVVDYIRGLYDANGALGITSTGRCFISLCANSDSIKDYILEHIKLELGIAKQINRNKRDGIYNICLFDEDAQKYTKLLYGDSCIHVDRKYCKYLEIQEWKRTIQKIEFDRKRWTASEDRIASSPDLQMQEKRAILDRTDRSIKMRSWRLTKLATN